MRRAYREGFERGYNRGFHDGLQAYSCFAEPFEAALANGTLGGCDSREGCGCRDNCETRERCGSFRACEETAETAENSCECQ